MGYKIIKDKLNAGEEFTLDGRCYDDYQGGKNRYRLLDDDGEIYFYILSDANHHEGTEEELFAPLDHFTSSHGCTEIQYKDDNGKYETL